MVALRLIPCLDVAHGRVVKGVNFVNLRDSGDPVELACRYSDEGADELVFLDIRASVENRNTLVDLVSRTAKSVKIPIHLRLHQIPYKPIQQDHLSLSS